MTTVTPLHYDGQRKVLVSAQDITERKHAETELLAERAELQAVYDNAPTMMCLLDEGPPRAVCQPHLFRLHGERRGEQLREELSC